MEMNQEVILMEKVQMMKMMEMMKMLKKNKMMKKMMLITNLVMKMMVINIKINLEMILADEDYDPSTPVEGEFGGSDIEELPEDAGCG